VKITAMSIGQQWHGNSDTIGSGCHSCGQGNGQGNGKAMPRKAEAMTEAMAKLGRPDAAEHITNEIFNLIEARK
jgi:hypothetical protein